ncbi:MAG: NACHT domain-containing protein [Oscillospiraceae bacterium]|nr:NACHT domain-containing protein [Oscillospiraceae bacterium]
MKTEPQPIESANLPTAVLSPLSQTGDKNTQIAHAGKVVINHIYQNQPIIDAVPADDSFDSGWVDTYHKKAIAEYGKMRTVADKTAKDFYSFYVCCDIKSDDEILHAADVAKLCSLSRRIIISASGGFGKSTMMRYLLLSAIEQYGEFGLVPIFVRLGDYAYSSATDMLEYILEQSNCFGAEVRKEELVSFLKKGKCCLLLDGLDEASTQEIGRLDYIMRPFFAMYADNFFVVTTRPYPIHKLNSLTGFDIMELQPLRYEQAVELVRKQETFSIDTNKITAKHFNTLTRSLFEKQKILMCNPRTLTMLAKKYERRWNTLPDDLHREVVISYAELYDTECGNPHRMLKTRLNVRDIVSRFAVLCYKAYEKGEYEFTQQTIDSYLRQVDSEIDGDDFLFDVCENLSFLEEGGGKFRFSHRSVQEYFCASYLSRLQPEQLTGFRNVLLTRFQEYSESVLRFHYEMMPGLVEEHIFLPFLTKLFSNSKKHTGYYNYLFSQYPVIYYDHEEPLEESDNQPLSPLVQFLLVMLDVQSEHALNDFPFYEEFAVWVTAMPVWTFANDATTNTIIRSLEDDSAFAFDSNFGFLDIANEVMPPKRIPYAVYAADDGDEIYDGAFGWELEFKTQDVYAAYKKEGKYGDILRVLDSDDFELKAEYLALFNYYETLKLRYDAKDNS